ncbi:class I SAM-dependent methyltransferase [Mycobacterium cookii]|uniref:Class I SAM-dependent methyltransferase n=1 Tax=Nocardioides furvisabuli TaxID=375542 RepID=A0ABN2X9S4_9ACTN|nr:methyltransferase [Nocardioides furvisabuli]
MPDDLDLAAPLREALLAADFTYDRVAEAIGEDAHRALGRNETLPALRRTSSGSALDTLVRLFLLQSPVDRADAERTLPGLVDRLCNAGLLQQSVGEVAARMDCRPYATSEVEEDRDLWVVSDLTPGLDGAPVAVGADHVLGISSASTSLAQLTMREPVGRALDLGTGCGVQALHLAAHANHVVATDVNARALWMTRFNAALNDVSVDVRDGSFFEPVAGERFDLIATNPPFVISPATGERLVYRDSGLPGDRVVEHIVRTGPDHLAEGGWLQVLANWSIVDGRPWDERLGSWLRADCDALVVQRETLDPASYVELWLKDSGHHGGPDYARRYDTWLSWLEESGIEGIGFGWINVRLGAGTAARHELLEWPYDVEQPIGAAIHDWGTAVEDLRGLTDDALMGTSLRAREDVQQEAVGRPGAEDPEAIVLRQQRGFRRARTADTVEAAFLGACDGDLGVGQLLGALAQLTDTDADQLQSTYLPVVRELVSEGFLEVIGPA